MQIDPWSNSHYFSKTTLSGTFLFLLPCKSNDPWTKNGPFSRLLCLEPFSSYFHAHMTPDPRTTPLLRLLTHHYLGALAPKVDPNHQTWLLSALGQGCSMEATHKREHHPNKTHSTYFQLLPSDRTTTWMMQMEICAHFLFSSQPVSLLQFPFNSCTMGSSNPHKQAILSKKKILTEPPKESCRLKYVHIFCFSSQPVSLPPHPHWLLFPLTPAPWGA